MHKQLFFGGMESLGDVELLACLFEPPSLEEAARLLDRFDLAALEQAGLAEIEAVSALSREDAVRVKAAFALGRRASGTRVRGHSIEQPSDVYHLLRSQLENERQEMFLALALDAKNRLQGEVLVATGMLCSVEFTPREAFRVLVKESAASTIFVHNHPSGDPTPSPEDRRLSQRLAEAGDLLGIPVLDHIVIAKEGYASAMHE